MALSLRLLCIAVLSAVANSADCSADCLKELAKCVPYKLNAGGTSQEALDKCQGEINAGMGPLAAAGCVSDCEIPAATKEELLKLEGGTPSSVGGGGGQKQCGSSATPTEKPTTPTLCTQANQGCCDCGNLNGLSRVQTYTWWISSGSEQRCYSVYTPDSSSGRTVSAGEKRPVLFFLQCYAKDSLTPFSQAYRSTADRFGVYMVYISSPQGSWSWKDAVTNDATPRACSAAGGGNDHTYLDDIFSHLPTSAVDHDPGQVFAFGFSQNGMGAGYMGTCFQHKVTGVWRGGAGLSIKGGSSGPMPPGGEGKCDSCMYWPSYPCFQGVQKQPLRDCAMTYDNDRTVAQDATTNQPHALYTKSLLEGGDVRALIFKGGVNGIEGEHTSPQNEVDWVVGCVGLRDQAGQCSTTCESALQICVSGGKAYKDCLGLEGQTADSAVASACTVGCTPTWAMLLQSEYPTLHSTIRDTFGVPASSACQTTAPSTSICTVEADQSRSCSGSPSPSSSPSPAPSPTPSAPPSPSTSSSPSPPSTGNPADLACGPTVSMTLILAFLASAFA